MPRSTTTPVRVTVVGALHVDTTTGLSVTQHPLDETGPVTDTDVVVVGGLVEDPMIVLQRLRTLGVTVPVVVVHDDPESLRVRARLTPLLPRHVTFTTEGELHEALRGAAGRERARRRQQAVSAATNDQLARVPTLRVVQSLRLLDDLLEYSPVGVLVLALDGHVALVNGAAERLLDCAAGSLVHVGLASVSPELAAIVRDGGATAGGRPAPAVTAAVGDRTLEVRHWIVEAERPVRVVLLTDVTERIQAEAVLASEFRREREAARHLREAITIKEALISSLSHELRTPVAVAKGMAETIIEDGYRLSDEQRADFLRRILGNTNRLERLVTGLLDLDRVKRDKLIPKLSDTDVPALVGGAVDEARLEGHPLAVTIAPDAASAHIDALWLERIIVNLLTNADRYTPPGSPLELTVDRDVAGALRVQLTDHGPGVPDDQKQALFESFHQGTMGSPAGIGIGLALVRQFAELHGGSAEVVDTDGGGATFVVTLGRPADGGTEV